MWDELDDATAVKLVGDAKPSPSPSPSPHPNPSPNPNPNPVPNPHPNPDPSPGPHPHPDPDPHPNPDPNPRPNPNPNPIQVGDQLGEAAGRPAQGNAAASACDALVEAVKARSDGGEPNDDVSVVVVTMRPAKE